MNNILDLIKQSFIIMILGMIIVFIFIEIMIFFINLTHIIINKKRKSTESLEKIGKSSKEIELKEELSDKKTSIEMGNRGEKEIYEKTSLDEKVISAIFTAVKLYENDSIDLNIVESK